MFDAIAPRYDLLNHVLSAGMDRGWRNRAIDALALAGGGSGARLSAPVPADLALAAVARGRGASVVGVDFAARDASSRADEGARGVPSTTAFGWFAAMPRVFPVGTGTCDARDDRVRHSQRRRARTGAGRDCARPETRGPPRHSRIRPAAHPRDSARCTPGISDTCCRCRATHFEAPERVLVPAGVGWHLSAARRVCQNSRCHRFFTRPGRPSHLRHRLSVRGAKIPALTGSTGFYRVLRGSTGFGSTGSVLRVRFYRVRFYRGSGVLPGFGSTGFGSTGFGSRGSAWFQEVQVRRFVNSPTARTRPDGNLAERGGAERCETLDT